MSPTINDKLPVFLLTTIDSISACSIEKQEHNIIYAIMILTIIVFNVNSGVWSKENQVWNVSPRNNMNQEMFPTFDQIIISNVDRNCCSWLSIHKYDRLCVSLSDSYEICLSYISMRKTQCHFDKSGYHHYLNHVTYSYQCMLELCHLNLNRKEGYLLYSLVWRTLLEKYLCCLHSVALIMLSLTAWTVLLTESYSSLRLLAMLHGLWLSLCAAIQLIRRTHTCMFKR